MPLSLRRARRLIRHELPSRTCVKTRRFPSERQSARWVADIACMSAEAPRNFALNKSCRQALADSSSCGTRPMHSELRPPTISASGSIMRCIWVALLQNERHSLCKSSYIIDYAHCMTLAQSIQFFRQTAGYHRTSCLTHVWV